MKGEWNWMFDKAWSLMKEDRDKCKSDIIGCLKRKGGAASLSDCAEACCLSEKECRSLINSMSNVKVSPHGDVVLMDGLNKDR